MKNIALITLILCVLSLRQVEGRKLRKAKLTSESEAVACTNNPCLASFYCIALIEFDGILFLHRQLFNFFLLSRRLSTLGNLKRTFESCRRYSLMLDFTLMVKPWLLTTMALIRGLLIWVIGMLTDLPALFLWIILKPILKLQELLQQEIVLSWLDIFCKRQELLMEVRSPISPDKILR